MSDANKLNALAGAVAVAVGASYWYGWGVAALGIGGFLLVWVVVSEIARRIGAR